MVEYVWFDKQIINIYIKGSRSVHPEAEGFAYGFAYEAQPHIISFADKSRSSIAADLMSAIGRVRGRRRRGHNAFPVFLAD